MGKGKFDFQLHMPAYQTVNSQTVCSCKRVTSGKLSSTQRLFEKFPEEETASRSQFIARLKIPEFGRVLFDETICFDVN